jgi:hypothetical protein
MMRRTIYCYTRQLHQARRSLPPRLADTCRGHHDYYVLAALLAGAIGGRIMESLRPMHCPGGRTFLIVFPNRAVLAFRSMICKPGGFAPVIQLATRRLIRLIGALSRGRRPDGECVVQCRPLGSSISFVSRRPAGYSIGTPTVGNTTARVGCRRPGQP